MKSLVAAADEEEEEVPPPIRWRVVLVSAVVAFPFALALAYLASNPLVRRFRGGGSRPTASLAPGPEVSPGASARPATGRP